MNKKLLTVVIPTYNMEAYLSRCLDSLIIDRNLLEKVEVLVINDGSKDRSSEIAHGYGEEYPETFRVIDKENGNYGSCVNRGLAEATGKYFRLLDADDWFNTESFKELVEYLENCDSDVVLTNYSQRFVDKSILFNYSEFESGNIYRIDEIPVLKNGLCMHALTFRLDLLKEVGLKHQEGISYTDIEYDYYPLTKADTLTYYSLDLYQYFIGRDGQTISNTSFLKNKKALMKVASRVAEDYVALNDVSDNRKQILANIIIFPVYRFYLISLIFDKPDEDFYKLEQLVKQNKELKEMTKQSTYRKVPFVSLWRRFGIRCSILRFV